MASTGPLLLLLMSSLFLLCSLGVPQPSSHQKHHSVQKRDVATFLTVSKGIGSAISILSGIPKVIKTFREYVLGDKSDTQQILSDLKENFKTMNINLHNQLTTTKWHTWVSGPYQEAEVSIKLAWKNLNKVFDMCRGSCKKEKYVEFFKQQNEHAVSAVDRLHVLLTTVKTSFIADFRTLLSDHVRCHEKDVLQVSELVSTLMTMGNAVSLFYYNIHDLDKTDDLAQMTFETEAVMKQIYKNCLLYPDDYIQKDVFDLIDENQDRQKLATDIKGTLEKSYDRYDWMVVVFLTRHSSLHRIFNKFLNKHYLSGFMEVTKGEVSVAVAKQVKGNHARAIKVKEIIQKCVPEKTNCESLIETLAKCGGPAPWTSLKDTYTAVHAYPDKSHDSENDEEEVVLINEDHSSHIYTGKCKKYFNNNGHFRVMIKSDDEMNGLPLCENEKCGGPEKGECVRFQNILKETCECKEGYAGSKCDISLEEFKKTLRETETKPK